MSKQYKYQSKYRQAGVTLMELIAALAVMATVAIGARALYGSATSSQSAQQLNQDVASLQAGIQMLYKGQGGYGASGTALNGVLITAKKVPSTVTVSSTTMTHALNGTITATSTGTGYTMTLTNVPADACTSMLPAASGWVSVKAGTAAARTALPILPTDAATDCATGTTLIYTGM